MVYCERVTNGAEAAAIQPGSLAAMGNGSAMATPPDLKDLSFIPRHLEPALDFRVAPTARQCLHTVL